MVERESVSAMMRKRSVRPKLAPLTMSRGEMGGGGGAAAIAAREDVTAFVARLGQHLDSGIDLGQIDRVYGPDELRFVAFGKGHKIQGVYAVTFSLQEPAYLWRAATDGVVTRPSILRRTGSKGTSDSPLGR